MAFYKGIPFNGGMNSPSGSGAQHIVETIQAIIDFFQTMESPFQLLDSSNEPSFDWDNRRLFMSSGEATVNWNASSLLHHADGTAVIQWNVGQLNDSTFETAVDWFNRWLLDTDGSTLQMSWGGGIKMPSLPSSDPGVPGQLYQLAGAVMVSP